MGKDLEQIAHELRIDVLKMFKLSGTGHMAPALSCLDILVQLYFGNIINWERRFTDDRDRVILSKGHGCASLYAVLAKAGYITRDELWTFYKKNTRLTGLANGMVPGVEVSTGSLGQGICFGTGTALAAKMDGRDYRTYVILGDGESQEGTVHESAAFAAKENLGNFTVIMDYNRLQASGMVDDIEPLGDVGERWKSYGWNVIEIDGHNYGELGKALISAKQSQDIPTFILANTTKGYGVSLAENNPAWHSRAPKNEEWDQIIAEMNITMEDLEPV